MPAREARRLLRDAVAPVVDDGHLIGIVRRTALAALSVGSTVADAIEAAVSVRDDEAADAIERIPVDVDQVPVVDADGRLRGVIRR